MLQAQHQECTSEKEEEKKSPQYSRTTKRSTEITQKKCWDIKMDDKKVKVSQQEWHKEIICYKSFRWSHMWKACNWIISTNILPWVMT